MKIGAENKKRVITMAVLLAIALPLVVYSYKSTFGGSSAGSPSSRGLTTTANKTSSPGAIQDPAQDPRLRTDILDYSRSVKYEPGRDIFHMKALPTPTPFPVRETPTPPPAPPTPTPLPPIPVKYYGFASKPGEPRKVFLQSGERVFVVGQGEIVDRRYRLIQIQPNSVTMEDVLTNNRQPIPLTPR